MNLNPIHFKLNLWDESEHPCLPICKGLFSKKWRQLWHSRTMKSASWWWMDCGSCCRLYGQSWSWTPSHGGLLQMSLFFMGNPSLGEPARKFFQGLWMNKCFRIKSWIIRYIFTSACINHICIKYLRCISGKLNIKNLKPPNFQSQSPHSRQPSFTLGAVFLRLESAAAVLSVGSRESDRTNNRYKMGPYQAVIRR